MAGVSRNTEQKYLLNGIQYNAPIDWADATVEAKYIDDNTQPSLTISDYTFPFEARNAIKAWFDNNCFEGMPMDVILYNNLPQQVVFKSVLDFTSNYQELLQEGKVTVSVLKEDGIDDLYSKIEALTYGYLESIDAVGAGDYTDCDYVVEKKFNLLEIIMASVMLYLMIKELAEAIEKLADAIASVAGLLLFIGTGSTALGAALLAVLKALLIAAYVAVLIIAVINLAKSLFEALVPKKRTHKTIMLRTALKVVVEHLGYTLSAPSAILDTYYLPSNPRLDEKEDNGFIKTLKGVPSGIPNVQDFGYNCADMFTLAKRLMRGKIALINGVVHVRPMNDPFWTTQPSWNLPSVLINAKKYNLNELKSTKVYQFRIDTNDDWTIDEYKGTAYEVKTDVTSFTNKKNILLKGLEEVNFSLALGSRKSKLNAIEELLAAVGGAIDEVTGFFGGGTSFKAGVKSKVGVLRQTNNWHTVPKLLPLKGGKLSASYKTDLSAKMLYDEYLNYDSFIVNGGKRQRAIYEGVEIPFGIEDFKVLSINPYFKYNGVTAKIMSFNWTTGKDKATISFWVQEKYTNKLKETFIEPE